MERTFRKDAIKKYATDRKGEGSRNQGVRSLSRFASGPDPDKLLIVSPVDATIDPAYGIKGMSGLGQVVQDGEDLEFDESGNLYVTDDQNDHLIG